MRHRQSGIGLKPVCDNWLPTIWVSRHADLVAIRAMDTNSDSNTYGWGTAGESKTRRHVWGTSRHGETMGSSHFDWVFLTAMLKLKKTGLWGAAGAAGRTNHYGPPNWSCQCTLPVKPNTDQEILTPRPLAHSLSGEVTAAPLHRSKSWASNAPHPHGSGNRSRKSAIGDSPVAFVF